jgi:hypothetical protein
MQLVIFFISRLQFFRKVFNLRQRTPNAGGTIIAGGFKTADMAILYTS